MPSHWNVTCDSCKRTNFQHYRYKCLQCSDYDLCFECHENKGAISTHSSSHPFQCMLDRSAMRLFYGAEQMPEVFADSFTCPYCGKMGFSDRELVRHVQSQHRQDPTRVICPLCVAVPGNPTPLMSSLSSHVQIRHPSGIMRSGGGSGLVHDVTFDPVFGNLVGSMYGSGSSRRHRRSIETAAAASAAPPRRHNAALNELFVDTLSLAASHEVEPRSSSDNDRGFDRRQLRHAEALSNLAPLELLALPSPELVLGLAGSPPGLVDSSPSLEVHFDPNEAAFLQHDSSSSNAGQAPNITHNTPAESPVANEEDQSSVSTEDAANGNGPNNVNDIQ